MNIKNLKLMPVVGQPASNAIQQIAAFVKADNDGIKEELAASGSRFQDEIRTLSASIKSAEETRYSDWETAHDAAYNTDIADLGSKKAAALSSVADMVSNAVGVVDSISELSGSIVAEEEEVNAAIAHSGSLLSDSRANFRATFGNLDDFVLA